MMNLSTRHKGTSPFYQVFLRRFPGLQGKGLGGYDYWEQMENGEIPAMLVLLLQTQLIEAGRRNLSEQGCGLHRP